MNINTDFLLCGGIILAIISISLVVLAWWLKHRRPKSFKLHLVFYSLTNKNVSTMQNSATLADLLKHTFVAQATDSNSNVYQGTIAFTTVTPADPTQDTASADAPAANTIDVQA